MTTYSELPSFLAQRLSGRRVHQVTHGKSGDCVYRLTGADQPTLYLKLAPVVRERELSAEIARMDWLQGRLPVPVVVDSGVEDNWAWLLMSEVPGRPLHDRCFSGRSYQVARLLAGGLKQLHSLPVSECPFDMRLERMLSMAHDHLVDGKVDEDDFDSSQAGRSAKELWDEVLERRPTAEDLVVVHGDYCLPNVVAREEMISGFLDLGRTGVADRYRDLALVTRSLASNGHAAAVDAFFEAYGLTKVDHEKIEFYRLLDEFF